MWNKSLGWVGTGPSPRIRGESASLSPYWVVIGTIPANTGRIFYQTGKFGLEEGPSPRIRGESGLEDLSFYVKWDHPREYGENFAYHNFPIFLTGPSPRIRGECVAGGLEGVRTGTIPANTGRISWAAWRSYVPWDHPREYGENWTRQALSNPLHGPSPRIRGEWHTPRAGGR